MSGVLIHDGRRGGHRKWCTEAIEANAADGAILTPFSSPRSDVTRNPSANAVASAVRDAGGEVLFDAMTHARFLPGVNKTDFYDMWDLWRSSTPSLESARDQIDHITRVFARQDDVGSPHLAPTLALSSALGAAAERVKDLARTARSLDADAWQSLAGNRAFWAMGHPLDSFVGSLVELRAPVWVLTVTNDLVLNHVPDLTDFVAFSGLYRTVHSLSLRSRVIIAYADFAGLAAVAAGADTVGSGWDRAQRTFDPEGFKVDSDPGIRIPASYVTQGQLNAVLRRETADAIERWDAARARTIRGNAGMPTSDGPQRKHHLVQLRRAVLEINAAPTRAERVSLLRARYLTAGNQFDALISALSRIVTTGDKTEWCTKPSHALEHYATSEGL